MAITDLGTLAFGGSRTANQTSLTVATTAAVAAGELVVVAVSVDNALGPPGVFEDFSVTSVSVGGNNLIRAESCGPGISTAQVGPGLSVWWQIIPNPVALGQPIVANFANSASSDHAALNARHFSVGSGGITVESSIRQFVDTATDPPSMDITTANEQRLRYRAVSGRPVGSVGFGYTAGGGAWGTGTAYSGNAGGTSPDWEVTAYAQSMVSTGTGAVSDPSVVGGTPLTVNANIYIVFKELPLLGTLAATESGGDSAGFPGGVATLGTIQAYENVSWLTADMTTYTADQTNLLVNTAGTYTDIAAFNAVLVTGVTGTLAATEGVKDAASFAGTVAWPVITGTLAATEGNKDVAAFAGFAQASGALAATESADTAAFIGTVSAFGTLVATEARDTAAFAGGVVVAGVLAATEDADTADIRAVLTNAGTLNAIETDSDTAAFSGFAYTAVTLAATEAPDVPAFEGYTALVDEKVGELIAHEDRVGGYSEPRADSTLVTADNTLFHVSIDYYGQDRALFVGDLVVGGVLNAFEEWGIGGPTVDSNLITADSTLYTADQDHGGFDVAHFNGTSLVAGVFAATEAGDVANFGGFKTTLAELDATETTHDTARFVGGVGFPAFGILGAVEGRDTARFSAPKWEDVEAGNGLRNEVQRTVWLTGIGGRVTWLENEVEDTFSLQNLNPEVVSLTNEVQRITELRP